jgi:hypothetical protein
MAIHIVSGILILVLTITMSLYAFKFYHWNWRWRITNHSTLGIFVLFATIFITILGFIGWLSQLYRGITCLRYFDFFKVRWLHKLLGYGILIIS